MPRRCAPGWRRADARLGARSPGTAHVAQPSPREGWLGASRPGEAGHRPGNGARPPQAPGAVPPLSPLCSRPRSHEAPDHPPLPQARPAEPLRGPPGPRPGSLRGHGPCSEGPSGKIRAGWQGRESAAAPRGQSPRSVCSQGVQSIPRAGRASPGLAAHGAGPARLGEPPEACRLAGQEAAPRAAAAASPATCADLEKQSLGPAAARSQGPGRTGSPAPRNPPAARGCAPNPTARAAYGVSTAEESLGVGGEGTRAGLHVLTSGGMRRREERAAGSCPWFLREQGGLRTARKSTGVPKLRLGDPTHFRRVEGKETPFSPFRTSSPRPDVKSFPKASMLSPALR